MKLVKRIVATVLTLAVAISCFSVSPIETQAAAPKTNTYVRDSKNGVYYPTKVRVGFTEKNTLPSIYLTNEGDYVASVKSSSSNLVAKLTNKTTCTGNGRVTAYLGVDNTIEARSSYTISCYAKKLDTYTLTVTVKNAKNKTTCTKKIKVYAEPYSAPIKSFKYAGTEYYAQQFILTKKKSGKIQVSMNKGFKLQKIEVGTYVNGEYKEYSPEPTYKTIKNKSKISLATSTIYTAGVDSYDNGETYFSKSGCVYDYLYPVTIVRITYKDTKLGVVKTAEHSLFYKNK